MGYRNYPLVIASGVAVLLFSLVGAAAVTGLLPGVAPATDTHGAGTQKTAKAAAARKSSACRNCGVVTWVRTVEVDGSNKRAEKRTEHSITVRMDDGSERTLSQVAPPAFSVGARVRVNGNAVERG
jgi:outer membrane lipoprotein SlyB